MSEELEQVRYEIRTHRHRCNCANPPRFCLDLYRLMEKLTKAAPSARWDEVYPAFEEMG